MKKFVLVGLVSSVFFSTQGFGNPENCKWVEVEKHEVSGACYYDPSCSYKIPGVAGLPKAGTSAERFLKLTQRNTCTGEIKTDKITLGYYCCYP